MRYIWTADSHEMFYIVMIAVIVFILVAVIWVNIPRK
jgi:hypothetical protein